MEKQKYQLEYTLKTSDKVLFNRLSTAGGLNEWFADNVKVQGKIFTFVWTDSELVAEMTARKELKFVRYKWVDEPNDDIYFEFRINIDELTGDLALIITDFSEPDELVDAKELWDTQINRLRKVLGS
jgi:hypothetical protein